MLDDTYHPARAVKKRNGDISDMTLWRWLNDPELNFPKPVYINRRRYWLESELVAWEQEQRLRSGKSAA